MNIPSVTASPNPFAGPMPLPRVGYVYSPDGVLSDAEIVRFASAASQWSIDVIRPAWDTCMLWSPVAHGCGMPSEARTLALSHHAALAGALGYHYATQGLSHGIVGVDDSASAKGGWWRTAMHEAAELEINPFGNRYVLIGTMLVPLEVSDQVEDDDCAESNFLLPAYFDPDAWKAGAKVDHLGALARGLDTDGVIPMTAGGYASTLDVGGVGASWVHHDARGAHAPFRGAGRAWSRLARIVARHAS